MAAPRTSWMAMPKIDGAVFREFALEGGQELPQQDGSSRSTGSERICTSTRMPTQVRMP